MSRKLQWLPNLPSPIIYLITSGATTNKTTPDSKEFSQLLTLFEKAIAAEIPLVQIREKELTARTLYSLTSRAVEMVRGTSTRVLVNDRYDIAVTAGADGVQLTGQSLPAAVVRSICPPGFLIGVSTHSIVEAQAAKKGGADFILFGPVFLTESKRGFGEPQGLEKLAEVVDSVPGFPVIAVGGIQTDNFEHCLRSGAAGAAAIRLLSDAENLVAIASEIRRKNPIINHG